MKRLKPTVFVPTSLALAMAVVLPSMAFAEERQEELIFQDPQNQSEETLTVDFNGILAENVVSDEGYEAHQTHTFNVEENKITQTVEGIGEEDGQYGNISTAFGTTLETTYKQEPNLKEVVEISSDGVQRYTAKVSANENEDGVLDSYYDVVGFDQDGFRITNGDEGYVASLSKDHGLNIENNGYSAGLTEAGLALVELNDGNATNSTLFITAKDGIQFATTGVDENGEGTVTPGVAITPTGIKNLAAATEDGDAISFGQFNEVVDGVNEVVNGVNETVLDLDDAISAVSASVSEINKATKANDVAIQKNSLDNQLNAVKITKLDQDVKNITENIETADISNAFMDKINARQLQVVAKETKDNAQGVTDLKNKFSEHDKIIRRLNANNTGIIGVPPSSPPPTIIQTGSDNSAAIKKLNDSLAATDKRLDESNQRLNSAIDINDGVLTIKNDMNANNKKITKVANATNDSDAVNLGQLKAYVAGNSQASAGMNQLKGDIVRLDKNLKQGMAAQSALNGLFQPYGVGKFSATAAIGGYGTETAVAVGTGYRFNENLAGKGGIAFPVGGASQATYNLGINYEW